ncbi:hypothetical protein D3C76_882090 [compost metagenome]
MTKSAKLITSRFNSNLPASTLEISNISFISFNKSSPDEFIVFANSSCFSDNVPFSLFSAIICESTIILFNGVLSSWDMLAKNSDLYLLASSKASAFSSISFCAFIKFSFLAVISFF